MRLDEATIRSKNVSQSQARTRAGEARLLHISPRSTHVRSQKGTYCMDVQAMATWADDGLFRLFPHGCFVSGIELPASIARDLRLYLDRTTSCCARPLFHLQGAMFHYTTAHWTTRSRDQRRQHLLRSRRRSREALLQSSCDSRVFFAAKTLLQTAGDDDGHLRHRQQSRAVSLLGNFYASLPTACMTLGTTAFMAVKTPGAPRGEDLWK